ncbi:vigilin [Schizosaccharomyces japonicus yFS275]|uniref:Vigilin n=1 Tax=Schizosaccharomyces japonicus (strain yFS275 / FY16936) TaxID=402676 RepID=B6K4Y1_SCHJY|nr:vigilin [Schizosaccharomyces japonicus yFS275]EEB08538.1 vigilin [Schizosaccharomyces japonicus yFS275]
MDALQEVSSNPVVETEEKVSELFPETESTANETSSSQSLMDSSVSPSVLVQRAHEQVHQSAKKEVDKASKKKVSKPVVDVHSETAFPSLTPSNADAPKTRRPLAWVKGNTASSASSRTKSPASSAASPTASANKSKSVCVETVTMTPEQQAPIREFGKQGSVGEIIKGIITKTNTSINVSTASRTKTTTYLIRGKAADVELAKRLVYKNFGRQVVLKVVVPSFVNGSIIGAHGQTLKGIMERSMTNIQFPKREDESSSSKMEDEVDENDVTEITISGEMNGAEMARKEIEEIVNKRTSHTTVQVTSIPSDFYDLIRGPNNSSIEKMEEGKDLKINVPFATPVSEGLVAPIIVSGDKQAVRECVLTLEGLHEELSRTTIPTMISIPRRQHRFIAGEKASGIHEIAEKTGCSVVLPTAKDPTSELVIVRGPAMAISEGIRLTMERANSTLIDALNITPAYASAEDPFAHACILARLFTRMKLLAPIESSNSVNIFVPKREELKTSKKAVVLEISGKEKDGLHKAREELVQLVNNYPPWKFHHVEIDPLLQRYVIGAKGRNLQRIKKDHNVTILLEENDPDVVLCFEGEVSAEEKPEDVQNKLSELAANIQKFAIDSAKITSETLDIPSKYHKYIVGPKGTTLNAIIGSSDENVIVQLGTSSHRESSTENDVYIRGFQSDVERIAREIKQIVHEAKNTEILNSYVVEFEIPQEYSKNIIGKSGSNVMKLREKLGTQISIDDGHVKIQGIKKNVEEAKAQILSQVEALKDDTILRLNIPHEFHRALIGPNGVYVRRLEEKYDVRVRFPRENETDATSSSVMQPASADEVVIRGGKKSANAAKGRAYGVVQLREKDEIVGRNGMNIENLRTQYGVMIDIEDSEDSETSNLKIKGEEASVKDAVKTINEVVTEIENQVEKVIIIENELHRSLIGPGGSTLQKIILSCGGPSDRSISARLVSFPKESRKDKPNEVVLRGEKQIVEALAEKLLETAEELKNRSVLEMTIPQRTVSAIIGRMGSTRRDIEEKASVKLNIPNRTNADTVTIKIEGIAENCEQARKLIEDIVEAQYQTTTEVPKALAQRLLQSNILRNAYSRHHVYVDRPHKMEAGKTTIAVIADEEEAEYPWKLVREVVDEADTQSWTIRGRKENVEKAISAINTFVDQQKNGNCVGYLNIPSKFHRVIIGAGGSTVNKIRKETKTQIDIPRTPGDDIVTIKGDEANVQKTRELIIEVVSSN